MTAPAEAHPQSEYQRRLHQRREAGAHWAAADNTVSVARGVVFLAGVAGAALMFSRWAVSGWWLLLPAIVFLLLVIYHARVTNRLAHAKEAVRHYEAAVARLEDRWIGQGASGERYADPAHIYAGDLDIFGRGSLFQLIARARTRLGEDTLGEWLSRPADLEAIRARQRAIDELRPRLDLREELALLNAEVHDELDQNRLRRWSQEEPHLFRPVHRLLALLFAAAAVVGLIAWLVFGWGPSPFVLPLGLQMLLMFTFRRRIRHVSRAADEAESGLAILSQVLGLMEREQFHTPMLRGIRGRLDTDGLPPSRRIAQLEGLIQYLNNSLQNQFFAPIAFILGLPIHLVHAVEKWRLTVGPHIPDWLQAVGDFEALSSLAGYAYEHPHDPFPEVVADGPLFDGVALGHPLLPMEVCVTNNLSIGGELRLILVSGSNMSGKSTLLRTVGSNAVLALAGAPVRAKRLAISPLQVGTAMRINDSLQDGKSLFYAVISRLKSVVELAGRELPLLFLLDEILQGTNSHDRRVGAEAVIRNLISAGAVGLVTTHDLALTEIAATLDQRATNIHFEDRLVDGTMKFDYRIRPGVVQKSNALELMRMMGLEVQ